MPLTCGERSVPDASDAVREFAYETPGIDMQRDMHARRLRVDQPFRVADGAAARVDGDGCGKRIMQRHACGEKTHIGLAIGGDGEVGDIGKEAQHSRAQRVPRSRRCWLR